ncbi:MAG: hypothetical protein AABX05_00605 [Nanoarchaeota archaeon]
MAKRDGPICHSGYRPRYQTTAHLFLDMEKEDGFPVTDAEYITLDNVIARAKKMVRITNNTFPEAITALRTIDDTLKESGFTNQNGTLVSEGLRRKIVNCHVRSNIYKAIAETVGLPIALSNAPGHVFVRWLLEDGRYFNWETTSNPAKLRKNKEYRSKFNIAPEAIENGNYLSTFTSEQVLAMQYNNQGVFWKRKHQFHKAVVNYVKALKLDHSKAEFDVLPRPKGRGFL